MSKFSGNKLHYLKMRDMHREERDNTIRGAKAFIKEADAKRRKFAKVRILEAVR